MGENVADDPSKQDERDRSQVAGGEDYEIDYHAKKAGIYTEKTRRLIDQFGNDRREPDGRAMWFKTGVTPVVRAPTNHGRQPDVRPSGIRRPVPVKGGGVWVGTGRMRHGWDSRTGMRARQPPNFNSA